MIELRRSKVHQFAEDNLVTMHELADAFATWKENGDSSKLTKIILPIEYALSEIKSVIIRDSAIDSLCHGAQLAIPGILEISPGLDEGDLVAIYSQKGEVVALAQSLLSENQIKDNTKGYAFQTKRIIMKPNTYPKSWRTNTLPKEKWNTMFPKALLLAILIGVIGGPVFGFILFEIDEKDQLTFVMGDSISIVTEKTDFKIGEEILIIIINSGTTELEFSNASYGLEIKQLDGISILKPVSAQIISSLEPLEEFEFVWDQKKNNGEQVLEGLYKVTSNGISENGNPVTKSITINILK